MKTEVCAIRRTTVAEKIGGDPAQADPLAATMTFGDMQVGQEAAFEVLIRESDIDAFAAVSGDFSPLHVDDAFARSRGFSTRVVHGAYLAGLVSRMVGMHLPGENCLLQTVQMKFMAPTYAGTLVRISGTVEQVSEAARAAILKIAIAQAATGQILASAKVSIGFTEARDL